MMEAKEVYLGSGSLARNEGFEVHDGQDRYIASAALIMTLTYFVMQNRAKIAVKLIMSNHGLRCLG